MSSPMHKSTVTSTAPSAVKKVPLKGLFTDGIWHCNCTPRLPAARFQVRKEGPNTGRWFYTCQESKGNDCGFFLFADEASAREMRAVINNTRSEPEPEPQGATTEVDPSKDKRSVLGHIEASNKWMEDLGKSNDEEFGGWPLSADDERELSAPAPAPPGAYPETPRKVIKTSIFATPSSRRKRDAESLPTPATGGNDIFTSPPTVRPRGGMWDGNERFGPDLRTPSKTAASNRFYDANEGLDARTEGPSQSYDITHEVFEVLQDAKIDDGTRRNLEQLLKRHALRISGIAKGRDITRAALRVKEEAIVELKERVGRLEVERDLDKTIIRHFKNDVSRSVSRKGKARGRNGVGD